MKWFLVKLVFSIEVDNFINGSKSTLAQFDEQLRLIEVEDLENAHLKARHLGKNSEATFTNSNNKLVNWRFIDVKEIILIGDIRDGVEIYSNTVETDDKENYINSILLRSLNLQTTKLVLQ